MAPVRVAARELRHEMNSVVNVYLLLQEIRRREREGNRNTGRAVARAR